MTVEVVISWEDGEMSQALPEDPGRAREMVTALARSLSPGRASTATWTTRPPRARR